MSSPQPPLRRMALPLGLSVLAHAVLLAALGFVRQSGSPEASGQEEPGRRFSIGLASLERTARRVKAVAIDEENWEPVMVQSLQPAPAGEPGSSPGPVVLSPAGPGASRRPGVGTGIASRGLLPVPPTARRIVYLLDCSVSMGPSGALTVARREIVASLRQLPPNALFQVVPYNQLAEPFRLDGRRMELVPAAPAVVEEAVQLLDDVKAGGRTDHAGALRCALRLTPRPDVLFLVTDAGDLELEHPESLFHLLQAGPALHVVELSCHRAEKSDLLDSLSRATHGSYRRVPLDR